MKRILFVLLSLLAATAVCLCLGACGETPPDDETDTVKVMLTVPEGVTVTGDNPLTVNAGENAVFTVTVPNNMVFLSTDAGTFDVEKSTLTVSNVKKNTTVNLLFETVDYDTTADVRFTFEGKSGDASSVDSGTKVRFGSEITVIAGGSDYFLGWYFATDKTKIVSNKKTYTFRVTPDIATLTVSGVYRLVISPKYVSLDTYYYNANGGVVHTDTVNAAGNAYMSVTAQSGDVLKVKLTSYYLNRVTCATAFWNDGTFTRDGYILKEYNTKADGTGEAYSPGSKFYQLNPDGSAFTLYCIWEAYDVSKFTYESVTFDMPTYMEKGNTKTVDASNWHTSGVKITGYSGDDKTVVVPDEIGGQPVLTIGREVFKGKSMETLVLPRTLLKISDTAFDDCASLTTMYYPNGIYYITDDVMNDATYASLKHLYVYASMAPRYSQTEGGNFSIKFANLLTSMDQNRFIVISGSSSFQGMSSPYLEALLDGNYKVINLGTTRTAHCAVYLEAMAYYAHEGDIVMFAPENSTYVMGDTHLYWKTLRDLEGMNNIFRYLDISNYNGVFTAFRNYNQGISEDNQTVRSAYAMSALSYECVCECITSDRNANGLMNVWGDSMKSSKDKYIVEKDYKNVYTVTLNAFYRNHNEGAWQQSGTQNDYTVAQYWSDITKDPYLSQIRHCVKAAKSSGAQVYFGFCPTDADAVIAESRTAAALNAYTRQMATLYGFDGTVGKVEDFIFAHEYFFDCAFHPNNYGVTWRTYRLYTSLCALTNQPVKYQNGDLGTDFDCCMFEKDAKGNFLTSPKYSVSYLK